jgi:hypothetical protein
MWKLVAVVFVALTSVAHAQMPEPTVDEPVPADASAEATVDATAQPPAVNEQLPWLAPPSSSYPQRAQPVAAQSDHSYETPPLSGGRLLGEAFVGGLFGAGGILGGGYVGYKLETSGGCGGEYCGLGGAVLGGVVGLAFVTPVGVYMIGNTDGQTGSLGATIGGSVIGTLVGIGAAAASQNEAGVVLLLAGPLVGSMVGFNATRKYVVGHNARKWAPVANVSQGNTSFGVVGRF